MHVLFFRLLEDVKFDSDFKVSIEFFGSQDHIQGSVRLKIFFINSN